ncbi:MAG: uroporphyrinogen decarboxylase family protein [Gemmatimonadota bacterium]
MRYLEAFPFDELEGLGGVMATPSAHRDLGNDGFQDGYGCRFRYMGVGLPYCVYSPLAGAGTVAEVEAFPWPDPEAPEWIAPDAAAKAEAKRQSTDGLIAVGIPPLFHQYHYLRGFEAWMLDIAENRAVHEAIAGRLHHIHKTLILRLLAEVAPFVDLVSTGDDLGHSTAPYMSPADLRALVKPRYADLIGSIKGRWPHLKFYLHSHGQIMDFVPDLVECGVDVLNPVLPLDHMDAKALKRDFGSQLTFHGGIDIERIVPFGTVREVRDHVREVIDILGPGGGYWLKCQAISPVMPPANVMAAYDGALEYGVHGS